MSPIFVWIVLFNLTYIVRTHELTYVYKSRQFLALKPLPPQKADDNNTPNNVQPPTHIVVLKNDHPAQPQPLPKDAKSEEVNKTNGTTHTPVKNGTKVDEHKGFKAAEMESGALLRGVSVVVVLTTIVIIYMALTTYCRRRGKNPVMVSKYGVRTRRSDIEMTPLPLSEDEDDETLFDVNNTNR